MEPLRIVLADSRASSCDLFHSEKFNSRRPFLTSRWINHEIGAMLEYQGQIVWLLCQSKHARTVNSRVRGLSQAGSTFTDGFMCSRP